MRDPWDASAEGEPDQPLERTVPASDTGEAVSEHAATVRLCIHSGGSTGRFLGTFLEPCPAVGREASKDGPLRSGEGGIRTLGTLWVHTLSRRAPSAARAPLRRNHGRRTPARAQGTSALPSHVGAVPPA